MTNKPFLWEQKANSQKTIFASFGVFLYEFIGARFSFFAFLGLFNVLSSEFQYFGFILSAAISILIFMFLKDAFNNFWNGINLKYAISKQGVHFDWGVFHHHELDLEFDQISNIFIVDEKERRAIIFENKEGIKNSNYGFGNELSANVLSFENVNNLEEVKSLLLSQTGIKISKLKNAKPESWIERFAQSLFSIKIIQLIAFVYMYLAIYLSISMLDNKFLPQIEIQDKVVREKISKSPLTEGVLMLKTENGHTIKLHSNFHYINENVNFTISPIFKQVSGFSSYKLDFRESILNGYKRNGLLFKFLAILVLGLSCAYMLNKKGVVHFQELSILIFFPLFLTFVAVYLFY